MPNLLPPIVSSSPPPLDPLEDDENDDDGHEDDFGDFAGADFASHKGEHSNTVVSSFHTISVSRLVNSYTNVFCSVSQILVYLN